MVSLALLAFGAVACEGSEAGTPNPTAPASGGPSSSTGPSLPPRPQELPLDGVDPCTLLTEQQRASLAFDQPPFPDKQLGGPLKDSPTCSYRSSAEQFGALIIAGTAIGLDEYLGELQANPNRRVIEVRGFPAVQDQMQGTGQGNDACFVDLDVADGQLLELQFGQIAADEDKVLPMETLCAKAVEVAEAALTTLQEQR